MTKKLRVIANASDAEPDGGGSGAAKEVIHVGARTPEELETLFEDTLMMRGGETLVRLFEEGAVLVANGTSSARGVDAIVQLALATLKGDDIYIADPRRVIQARDVALIVGERAINVGRRGPDGSWRYVILLMCDEGIGKEPL